MNDQNDNPPVKVTSDPRCLAWARETLSLENRVAHRAILTAVQAAGVPGKEQGALRDATWKIRLHLLKENKAQRKAAHAAERAQRVEPPQLTPEVAAAADQIERIEENLTESFTAELGVAPPQSAKPGRPLIGFREPGTTWGPTGFSWPTGIGRGWNGS